MYFSRAPIKFALLLIWLTCSITLMAEEKADEPLAQVKTSSLKGSVIIVDVTLGKGPASFRMKLAEGQEVTVILGSVRYIIQKGFNLSAGDLVEAKVFSPNGATDSKRLIAIEVRDLTQDKFLRLRDERLRPLWRGRNF